MVAGSFPIILGRRALIKRDTLAEGTLKKTTLPSESKPRRPARPEHWREKHSTIENAQRFKFGSCLVVAERVQEERVVEEDDGLAWHVDALGKGSRGSHLRRGYFNHPKSGLSVFPRTKLR